MLRVNLSPSPKDLEKKKKKTERPIADDAIIITYQR
jgi:hypothetical protein